jgi:hypothetical protein
MTSMLDYIRDKLNEAGRSAEKLSSLFCEVLYWGRPRGKKRNYSCLRRSAVR